MTKQNKNRKEEIICIAGKIFAEKGYEKTTVEDIVQATGIAKGTLYHHFKSKEEIMEAIALKIMDGHARNIEAIINLKNISAVEKMLKVFMIMQLKSDTGDIEAVKFLHSPENLMLHQRFMSITIKELAPLLAKIIEQGIEEKVFTTQYPLEAMEQILILGSTWFDFLICNWSIEETKRRMLIFAETQELLLGAKKGSLTEINKEMLKNMMDVIKKVTD